MFKLTLVVILILLTTRRNLKVFHQNKKFLYLQSYLILNKKLKYIKFHYK